MSEYLIGAVRLVKLELKCLENKRTNFDKHRKKPFHLERIIRSWNIKLLRETIAPF